MIPNRTYEERKASVLEVLDGFSGRVGKGEEAYENSIAKLGAYGWFAGHFALADIWARPGLSRRDRSMIVIAMTATLRATEELAGHTEIGFHHGLSRVEVEETILQVAAYAGFPNAGNAFRVTSEVFDRLEGPIDRTASQVAVPKSDVERRADGYEVLMALYGDAAPWSTPDEAAEALFESNGAFGQLALDFVLGEIWTRPGLTWRDRSLITVVVCALTAPETLDHHIPGALNNGVTRDEIMEAMLQVAGYAGFQRGARGVGEARMAFDKLDASPDSPSFELTKPTSGAGPEH